MSYVHLDREICFIMFGESAPGRCIYNYSAFIPFVLTFQIFILKYSSSVEKNVLDRYNFCNISQNCNLNYSKKFSAMSVLVRFQLSSLKPNQKCHSQLIQTKFSRKDSCSYNRSKSIQIRLLIFTTNLKFYIFLMCSFCLHQLIANNVYVVATNSHV